MIEHARLTRIRWGITIGAICLTLAHNVFPQVKLDTTSIILLIIALVPWLAPIVKSVELPGGFKIEVQDVKEATDKVTATVVEPAEVNLSGMRTANVRGEDSDDSLVALRQIFQSDPNLAMVGFRIEIEGRLATLARRYHLDPSRKSASQLLRMLQEKNVIPASAASGLADLIALGNQAAHGADVSPNAAQWVLEVSPRVLTTLDQLIANAPSN